MIITEEELLTATEGMEWVIEERDKLIEISEKMEPLRKLRITPPDNAHEWMCKMNEEVKKIEKDISDPCMRKYAHLISNMHRISHEEFLKYLSSPKEITTFITKIRNMEVRLASEFNYDNIIISQTKKRYASTIPLQEDNNG